MGKPNRSRRGLNFDLDLDLGRARREGQNPRGRQHRRGQMEQTEMSQRFGKVAPIEEKLRACQTGLWKRQSAVRNSSEITGIEKNHKM